MLPLKYEQSPSLGASEFKKGIFDAVSLRKVKDEIVQNDAFIFVRLERGSSVITLNFGTSPKGAPQIPF